MYEDLVAHYLHPGMDIAEVESLLGEPETDLKGGDLKEALVNRNLKADRLLGYTVTERVDERQEVRIALNKGKVIRAWVEWFSY